MLRQKTIDGRVTMQQGAKERGQDVRLRPNPMAMGPMAKMLEGSDEKRAAAESCR